MDFLSICKFAKNLFKKKDSGDLKREWKAKRSSSKHSPLIVKGKEFCGRLNRYQWKIVTFLRKGKFSYLITFIKKNAARAGILLCAIFVSFANIKSQNKNILGENSFLAEDNSVTPIHKKIEKSNSLASAPIAEAYELTEYEQYLKEEGEKNTIVNVLTPVSNPTPEEFDVSNQDVFVYKVEEGDTAGSIAQKYSITVNTILWANDLTENSIIKPGDEIFILPITGIKHKVKKGDSVKALAKAYKADEKKIIKFNDIPADGDLKIGEEIIIPDGKQKIQPQSQYAGSPTGVNTVGSASSQNSGTLSKKIYQYPAHRFPYGWCTWYVASRKHVPWGGNAGTWLYHARAYGASTGKTPQVGAIVVTGESRYGHVAIVEKVKGGQITVSEMNYSSWGKVSSRTISASSSIIKGYIY
jgi:surface antigen